jgi:amino acid transporter
VLSTGLVVLLTLVNLRGVKEAGILFAVPTYGFVAMVYLLLGVGFFRCLSECPQAATANLPLEATAPLSLFLILKAFSSGATALTGWKRSATVCRPSDALMRRTPPRPSR